MEWMKLASDRTPLFASPRVAHASEARHANKMCLQDLRSDPQRTQPPNICIHNKEACQTLTQDSFPKVNLSMLLTGLHTQSTGAIVAVHIHDLANHTVNAPGR
jgi:hypothetical protein